MVALTKCQLDAHPATYIRTGEDSLQAGGRIFLIDFYYASGSSHPPHR
jgi:hypothetical protein